MSHIAIVRDHHKVFSLFSKKKREKKYTNCLDIRLCRWRAAQILSMNAYWNAIKLIFIECEWNFFFIYEIKFIMSDLAKQGKWKENISFFFFFFTLMWRFACITSFLSTKLIKAQKCSSSIDTFPRGVFWVFLSASLKLRVQLYSKNSFIDMRRISSWYIIVSSHRRSHHYCSLSTYCGCVGIINPFIIN